MQRLDKRLALATALSCAAFLPAIAAEISVPPGVPAPQLAPIRAAYSSFNWSGCHIGGHLGGVLVSGAFDGQLIDDNIPSTFGAPTTLVVDLGSADHGAGGVLGGGQVGCDLQGWRWVIGFDADASGTILSGGGSTQNLSTTLLGNPIPAPTTVVTTGNLSESVHFIATATGRVGYVYDPNRGLFYGKGGAAWMHATYSFSGQDATTSCAVFDIVGGTCTSFNPVLTRPFNTGASETRLGWTVGFGWEYAITNNVSAKLEYDYLGFGSKNLTFTGFGPSAIIGVSQHINELKAGVNYLFN